MTRTDERYSNPFNIEPFDIPTKHRDFFGRKHRELYAEIIHMRTTHE